MKTKLPLLILILTILSIYVNPLFAQDIKISNPDSLFSIAQKAAYNKELQLSRKISQNILDDYPDYLDAKTLIARTLAWEHNYDSSRKIFNEIILIRKKYYDALDGLIDVETWDENNALALFTCNQALNYYPNDENFIAKKVSLEIKLGQTSQAKRDIRALLAINPSNKDALELLRKLKHANILNKMSVEYTYEYFDEPWTRRWNLFALSYTRQTTLGPIIARAYIGDIVKLDESIFEKEAGFQYELEAYPKISKTNYTYVSFAYSSNLVFPKYRAAFEFYQKLPKNFEASLGVRYLQFILDTGGTKDLLIYTGSIGYYFRNFWVSFRPYLSPKNSDVEQSYYLDFRSYFNSKDNFLNINIGTGSTPDDPGNDVGDYELYKLNKYRIRFSYQHLIFDRIIIEGNFAYQNEEFKKDNNRDVLSFGLKTHLFF